MLEFLLGLQEGVNPGIVTFGKEEIAMIRESGSQDFVQWADIELPN